VAWRLISHELRDWVALVLGTGGIVQHLRLGRRRQQKSRNLREKDADPEHVFSCVPMVFMRSLDYAVGTAQPGGGDLKEAPPPGPPRWHLP